MCLGEQRSLRSHTSQVSEPRGNKMSGCGLTTLLPPGVTYIFTGIFRDTRSRNKVTKLRNSSLEFFQVQHRHLSPADMAEVSCLAAESAYSALDSSEGEVL